MVPSRFLTTSQHQNSHGVHSPFTTHIGSVPIAFSDLRVALYVSCAYASTGINPSAQPLEYQQESRLLTMV